MRFFATAAKGIEPLLEEELRALGASEVAATRAGVSFDGTLETAYRACLWSRLASRVLLPIAHFDAPSPEALYDGAREIPWPDHLSPDRTLAVDATLTRAKLTDNMFAALKTKDAIVDVLRDATGARPSVRRRQPDVQINLHVDGSEAIVSIDLSGDSLHRRGYRTAAGVAPLRETLAAAILHRAGWPEASVGGAPLVDPMCGSGTFLIEAALMAIDGAPGLRRGYFGLIGWLGHDRSVWKRLLDEARERRKAGEAKPPALFGYDLDGGVVRVARDNAKRADVRMQVERRDVADLVPPADVQLGLLVTNPPYGERMGEKRELERLYAMLGARLKLGFGGWTAFVLTDDDELGKSLGLRASKRHRFYNGSIPCRLLTLPIHEASPAAPAANAEGREALANRLRKNLKALSKWAGREGVTCYRVYDADIPEYAVAVDLYEGRAVIQEYAPPRSIPKSRAAARLEDVRRVVPEALGLTGAVLKVRRRQKGPAQYEKLAERGRFVEVGEGGLRFWVNLTDYVDTGLFLDHRPTRARIRELAEGRRFLNLFGYTGTATVYAAAGGATASTTVDMSNTYVDWAHKNFELNGLDAKRHELVHADCLQWIEQTERQYGLIFLDPPTFSTSKSMKETLDIQRDHVALIQSTLRLLEPDGVLLFACNFRRFKIDRQALASLEIRDVTRSTIPKDFQHNARIHCCFEIQRA